MKIGIITQEKAIQYNPNDSKFFSNGVKFNSVLWYDFFKKCGHDVTYIIADNTDGNNPKHIYVNDNIKDNKESRFYKFDVVFVIQFVDFELIRLLKQNNTYLIFVVLGSKYHNDVHNITDNKYGSIVDHNYDELWISPHFEYSRQYLEVRYKTKVYICPYIWGDALCKPYFDKTLTDVKEKLRVAIVEPNLEQAKNCLIPISICEKASQYISKVNVFNTFHLKQNKFFKSFILNLDICKEKKIFFERRHPLPIILSEYCNCVISYVEDCDLNYVFLECFYLGIPLIHNSPMLKEYGYYYPRLNISKAVQQIEYIIKKHDRYEYIKKHKHLLDKYSINNPSYIGWVNGRLDKLIDFDCL